MQVTPLHDRIGAEVTGLDLRRRPSEATVQALHDALHKHIVLVFRGQHFTHPTQLREAMAIFGEKR